MNGIVYMNSSDDSKRKTSISRRNVLLSSGSIALTTSLAGCGSTSTDGTTNVDSSPSDRLQEIPIEQDTLERYDLRTITGSQATVSYWANILLYSDTKTEQKIKELTLNEFTQSPARILGTIYVQLEGFGSGFVVNQFQGEITNQIANQFEPQLDSFGVQNVTEVQESDYSKEYRGEIDLGTFTLPKDELPIDTEVTIDGGTITIEAGFDIWDSDGAIIGFMWVEPVGEYSNDIDPISVSGELGEGVDVDPQLTLDFAEYQSVSRKDFEEATRNANPTQIESDSES